ncbi:MAG: DUF1837 domain-containing protein [Chitinophagaceae bacterium]|nr:DUF1837 domain-containing protein [Chitinophagaceae bacterium]MCW5927777.1 DUF1837 domain-containing protein [Chitinophagaceae bacterium]
MIEQAIQNLIVGKGDELKAYLEEVNFNISIPNTKAIAHCHFVQLDGNGRPRVNDFIEYVSTKMLEYSIPRSEIAKAKEYCEKYNTPSKYTELDKKAKKLFTDITNTGEGGEILLYILVQEFLKIPQLFCKMPLKTNSQMHYHGVDGIHVEYDQKEDMLALYWGESKIYKDLSSAVTNCFTSLKEYLQTAGGSDAPQERDLQLVKDNLDLNDANLEEAIKKYFDKGDPLFNKMQYRGVCLIGFDCDKYPTPNQINTSQLKALISAEVSKWHTSIEAGIKKHLHLDTFIIHVFLVPFPSVEDFREQFLKALSLK